jgi:hypothetical protein
MHSKVTINITDETLDYITDPAIFKAKKEITDQLTGTFTSLIDHLKSQPLFQSFEFPPGTDIEVGKISKGENYHLQPYLVCRFPRVYKMNDVFAYRVMFWWGHYFIFTFHLAGHYLEKYWPAIRQNIDQLRGHGYWVSNGQHEWEHAISREYYCPLDEMNVSELRERSAQAGFLKIAQTLPLPHYKQMPDRAIEIFHGVLNLL